MIDRLLLHALFGFAVCGCAMAENARDTQGSPIAIAIHGGAGTITRQSMTSERERAYREGLEQAAARYATSLGLGLRLAVELCA